MNSPARRAAVFIVCLTLTFAPEAFVAADFLSPPSQLQRVEEAMERRFSFMGLKPKGNRVMAPPTAIAEFEFQDGVFEKGGFATRDPGIQEAITVILGIQPEDLEEWWSDTRRILAAEIKSLRRDYGWLKLFNGITKIQIVYGRSDKLAHWDKDGTLILSLDLFVPDGSDSVPQGIRDFHKLALPVLRRSTLLHEGLHESEPFLNMVKEAIPGVNEEVWKAAVEIYASYYETTVLSSEIEMEPRILEVYLDDSNAIYSLPLEELLRFDTPEKRLRDIRFQLARMGHSVVGGINVLPNADAVLARGWEHLRVRMEKLALAGAMMDSLELTQRTVSHQLNNTLAPPLGHAELLLSVDSPEKYAATFRVLVDLVGKALQRYDSLVALENPYLVDLAHHHYEYYPLDRRWVPEEREKEVNAKLARSDPQETLVRLAVKNQLLKRFAPNYEALRELYKQKRGWVAMAERPNIALDAQRKLTAPYYAELTKVLKDLKLQIAWERAMTSMFERERLFEEETLVGGKFKFKMNSVPETFPIESPPLSMGRARAPYFANPIRFWQDALKAEQLAGTAL